MSLEFREDFDAGTELGRSPSGVPASMGAADIPVADAGPRETIPDSGVNRRPPPAPLPAKDEEADGVAQEPHLTTRRAEAAATGLSDLASRPRPTRRRRLVHDSESGKRSFSPKERLLILDAWERSGLGAPDFSSLVGVTAHTLYQWRAKFRLHGPCGLLDEPRGGPRGSRLPDLTRRTIVMLKKAHPEWGCQRISDMLLRGPALPASAGSVARVLHEAGYVLEETPTRPHPDKPREFERAKPNQLWQTDLFTFVLKRQNRRVYLVAFMDDHSRYIVGYGLHGTQSSALVIEVLRSAIASYQAPEELLSDNGAQYVTWRGKSAFQRELERLGIRHIVSAPRHPQTLGKIERFWGTLWRECVERAIFLDLDDARRRVGLFIDHYNFQRPHSGIGGLVPADRFFGAAPEVLGALKERVASNALELARHGEPKAPFYLAGNAGGKPFSIHAEGERVILRSAEGHRQEIDLVPPQPVPNPSPPEASQLASSLPEPLCPSASPSEDVPSAEESPPAPGTSPLDGSLDRLEDLFRPEESAGGAP